MKVLRNLISAIVLAAGFALCLHGAPALAAQQILCAPDSAVGPPGPRRAVNPNTTNAYSLNPQGCAAIGPLDVGYFLSQGFSQGPQTGAITFQTGVATGTTSFNIGSLPAGTYIQAIIWNNLTANAAGNLSVGTASGGAQVVAAVACAANCGPVSQTLVASIFSATSAQPLWFTSTAWNSANLNITVVYAYY